MQWLSGICWMGIKTGLVQLPGAFTVNLILCLLCATELLKCTHNH